MRPLHRQGKRRSASTSSTRSHIQSSAARSIDSRANTADYASLREAVRDLRHEPRSQSLVWAWKPCLPSNIRTSRAFFSAGPVSRSSPWRIKTSMRSSALSRSPSSPSHYRSRYGPSGSMNARKSERAPSLRIFELRLQRRIPVQYPHCQRALVKEAPGCAVHESVLLRPSLWPGRTQRCCYGLEMSGQEATSVQHSVGTQLPSVVMNEFDSDNRTSFSESRGS